MDKVPFQYDGTLYAEMIAEEAEEKTFLPTYLGFWAPWKPGLYFIAYSLFLPVTSTMFDSLEWIYKSPNLLFGALNAWILYLIAKRFVKEDVALVVSLLFYSCFGVIYVESRLLMETFALFPILLSLLFYTDKRMPPILRFVGAGVFALLAALTKSVISLMIIPLAIAYLVQSDRENLRNPFFLLSLLAPVLGLFIFYLALQDVGLVEEVLVKDTGKFFVYDYFSRSFVSLFIGSSFFFIMYTAYALVSIKALLQYWKKELFFAVWFLLSLIPILSGSPMLWHTYYMVPPLAFFAALAMTYKGKLDSFSLLLVVLLVSLNLAASALNPLQIHAMMGEYEYYTEAKQVGLALSGKENVLITGMYPGSTTIVAYKILSERQSMGSPLDFGYVILHSRGQQQEKGYFEDRLNAVVQNYHTQEYVFDESYAGMFATPHCVRKPTNLTEFDFVAVFPSYLQLNDPRYQLVYNQSNFSIYERSGNSEPQQVP